MVATQIIRLLTVAALTAVAVAAYRQRRGHSGRASRWIFLSFSLLAAITAILALLPNTADTPSVMAVRELVLASLPLFPYLLFRFTAALMPPARWIEWAAAALTANAVMSSLLTGGVAFGTGPRSTWYIIALLSQWTVLSVTTSVRLWKAGRDEPTVARRRIRTLSIAAIGLTIALLLAGAASENATAGLIIRLIALTSALLFLLALAPPPQLRAAWRRAEEDRLRLAIAELMAARTTAEVTAALLPCVATLLGGRGAALLTPDGDVLAAHGAVDLADPRERDWLNFVEMSSGRIAVFTSPYTPLFGREEFDLLRSLAHLAELALERSREYHIAETLQRSLLPQQLPPVPGFRVQARYLPGGEGAVGGDWYDVIALPDGRVGLVIGDVMGHGIGAAALMGHLRSALRAYALDGDPPERVLRRLDRFVQHLGATEMATVLYLVLDVAASTVSFASAGHPPPVLRCPGQRAVTLDRGVGPPLGVWEDTPPVTGVTLPPGASLVLFTDGLIERRGESITDGIERLQKALDEAPAGVARLCDHLVAGLLPGGAPADDVAILAVELAGVDEESPGTAPVEASATFDAVPRSAGEARAFVARALADWERVDDSGTVALLTSEVVTNAVIHAKSAVRLTVRLSGHTVRVTVADEDGHVPGLRSAGWAEESGRGLMLVNALSGAWGVHATEHGKQVWFELPVPVQAEMATAPG